MSDQDVDVLEKRLQEAGRALLYPPTPDLAAAVNARLRAQPRQAQPARPAGRPARSGRRIGWGIALAALLLVVLMAVPPVRAQILAVIQIGIVRIFYGGATPTPTLLPQTITPAALLPTPTRATTQVVLAIATPRPTPTATAFLDALSDLAGETTLEAARDRVGFPILLPSYPADLGLPERVFVQEMGAPLLVLVWRLPDQPDQVRLSLHAYPPGSLVAEKWEPGSIEETTVNGQRAYWTSGPYLLRLKSGDYDQRRLIAGHVLIWMLGEITYRLETDLLLGEAVRMAESLSPLPGQP